MKKHPIYLIAAALHLSIVIYVGIVFFLAHPNGWALEWNLDSRLMIMVYALTGASLMSAALALMAPKIFLRSPQEPIMSSPESKSIFFDFSQITPKIQTITIVRMVLAESVAIYGLVLAFLNHSPMVIVPFALASLVLQIIVGPFRTSVS